MDSLALYIHFPYCLYKCHYCDFNSYAVEFSDDLEVPYRQALLEELRQSFGDLPPEQITSVFFGGGTPSLFSAKTFELILNSLASQATLSSTCEITIEMNPKTVTVDKIQDYQKAGVNRFSMGVQSFQDRYLGPLGRLHTGEEAREAAHHLREAGVENFNLDLMFGFPGQSTGEVLADLNEALRFEPLHLSFYNLTLEEGTLLHDQHRKGKIRLPDNEVQAEMYEEGMGRLMAQGYAGYEISNFAKPQCQSRHNLAYWRYEDYLGLGAGAVSFLRKGVLGVPSTDNGIYGYRWTNPKTPKDYMSYRSYKTYRTYNEEKIDFKTAAGEFWMMGLRLKEGVSLSQFEKRFGLDLRNKYEERVIPPLVQKDWLSVKGDKVSLTHSGQMFANEVVSAFLL